MVALKSLSRGGGPVRNILTGGSPSVPLPSLQDRGRLTPVITWAKHESKINQMGGNNMKINQMGGNNIKINQMGGNNMKINQMGGNNMKINQMGGNNMKINQMGGNNICLMLHF